MTLQEAVRMAQADKDVWIRPVGVIGYAYIVRNNQLLIVPSKKGGEVVELRASEILSDWEITSADEVLK